MKSCWKDNWFGKTDVLEENPCSSST